MKIVGKEIGKKYQTKDLSIFKVNEFNRVTDNPKSRNHIKRLAEDMKKNGWMSGSTIQVNERGYIMDGHHRYHAAVEANVPVHYEIVKNVSTNQIAERNRNVLKWQSFDCVNSFVKLGYKDYITFNNLCKEYPKISSTEIMMLCHQSPSWFDRDEFESGNWKVKSENWARTRLDYVMSLQDIFPKGYKLSTFIRALITLWCYVPKFDFDQFLHKAKLRPNMLKVCGTKEGWIDMIEELYNYKSRENLPLSYLLSEKKRKDKEKASKK